MNASTAQGLPRSLSATQGWPCVACILAGAFPFRVASCMAMLLLLLGLLPFMRMGAPHVQGIPLTSTCNSWQHLAEAAVSFCARHGALWGMELTLSWTALR